MENSTKNFLDKFYSLPGTTIREKYQSFHCFLKENDNIDQIDLSMLTPKNYLEEKFKLKTVIHFQNASSILDILKSDNPVLIKMLLKLSSRLLKDAFQNIDESELVNEFFPHLSFTTKLKLLNRLARCLKDEQKSKEYFDAIFEKYGLYLASKLIPSCSPKKILDVLKNYRVEITSAQLLLIVKRHSNFTEQIFELLSNRKSKLSIGQKYKQVFVFLAKTNFKLFAKLNKKYNPDIKVGRKTTKLCIFYGREEIVENSSQYYKFLHKKQVYWSLREHDFDKYYHHLFPNSINEYKKESEVLLELLKHLPIEKKLGKLLTSFENNFGEELWNCNELVNYKLIQAMSPNDRELWMEKYSKPDNIQEEQWVSLMKVEKSIPLLINKIGMTSKVKLRSQIIPYFVKTCKINNDKKALVEVCKYVTMKHHNDHWRVRQGFLNAIVKHFDLSSLEEDHWKYINELLQFNYVNSENYYGVEDFLRAYIHFLISQNLPIDDQLKRWTKIVGFNLKIVKPKYKEIYWKYYLDFFLNKKKDDNSYPHYLPTDWPKIYCRDKKYSLDLLNFFKKCLAENIWGIEEGIVEWLHFGSYQKSERIELLNLIFTSENHEEYQIILKWLLVNDPVYVVDNLEIVFKTFLRTRLPLILFCKHFHHLGLPQKLCSLFKKELLNQTPDETRQYGYARENLICNALVILMATEDFLDFIQPYKPINSKIDVSNEEGIYFAKLQKSIAVCLKKLNPPACALESIVSFSQGDFLNLVQNSLVFVARNVAENKLHQFFQKLEPGTVSIQKASIYLQFELSRKEDIFAMVQRFENDKNYSICKALLKGTLNFFANNPNEITWSLLKNRVNFVKLNDEEAFCALIKWEKISALYLSKYLDFIWNFLKGFVVKKETENKKFEILDVMKDGMVSNLDEFSRTFILEHFGLPDCYEKLEAFTHQYIISENFKLDLESRLEFVFQVLQKYVSFARYNFEKCEFASKCLFNFVKEFCLIFLGKKCMEVSIFDNFFKSWEKVFDSLDFFDEFLYLKFTSFYLHSDAVPIITKQLTTFLENLYERNGAVIFESYWKILSLFLNHNCEKNLDQNRFDLIEGVRNGNSVHRLLLIIFLLPNDVPVMLKYKQIYHNILDDLLLQKTNFVTKIYLTKYLKREKNSTEESEKKINC